MCGIVGYIGRKSVTPLLLEGLQTLEYRGYDSSGIAIFNASNSRIEIHKAPGKLMNLIHQLPSALLRDASETEATETVSMGIGHIRWATHGAPTVENAHPHVGHHGEVFLVHNGIIENYAELKEQLQAQGYVFQSQTDTETIAHLLEQTLREASGCFIEALTIIQQKVKGAYAFTMMHQNAPGKLYVARKQAPLVIGIGEEGEYWVSSDVVSFISRTNRVIYLEDGQYGEVSIEDGIRLFDSNGEVVHPVIRTVQTGPLTIDKKGFKHFMLKEIHEQPDVLRHVISESLPHGEASVSLFHDPDPEAESPDELLKRARRLVIIGCGTSYNAGMVAKYLFESLTEVSVEVESAGEYRYRSPVLDDESLVIAISQSGETADTLEALRLASSKGAKTIALTNRTDSTIAREADAVINVRAGIEVSVCATKSFTAQIVALYLIAIQMTELRFCERKREAVGELKQALQVLPHQMEAVLADAETYQEIARQYCHHTGMLFIGRGSCFPAACEGALKLKEISYIHAEGYSGAELKHGPIALLDETMPVVALLSNCAVFEKMISNCQEAKARNAKIIAVTNVPIQNGLRDTFDHIAQYPDCHEYTAPILGSLPLQLLAYYTAEFLGKDVDQPRNLAKSVTVE